MMVARFDRGARLGEGVLTIKITPVAIAADQGGRKAIRPDLQTNTSLVKTGIAHLVGKPAEPRRVQFRNLLGFDHAVPDHRLHLAVLLVLDDTKRITGRGAAIGLLVDAVG